MICRNTMVLYTKVIGSIHLSMYAKEKKLSMGLLVASIFWDIHHESCFPMIELFSHRFVSPYKWPSGDLRWDE